MFLLNTLIQEGKGVRAIYASTEKANPNQWHFLEIYDNPEAVAENRKQPWFRAYQQEVANYIADRQLQSLEPNTLVNKAYFAK